MGELNNNNQSASSDNFKRKNLISCNVSRQIGEKIATSYARAQYKSGIMNHHDEINRNNPERQYNDKFKHSIISCEEAQKGILEAGTIAVLGLGKEIMDNYNEKNDLREIWEDLKADSYGIYKELTNRKGNCDEMLQLKYKKSIK